MSSIHFISGLPRSGSTLLAALLRQNPRFEAGMSGPLAGLFGALLGEMSARNEFSVFIDDVKRQRILRGLFDDFYADSKAEVIFDTMIIACVRELPWVIDSIERIVQRNVFTPSSIFNYKPGGTVYTRANGVAGQDGMVGGPHDALKQACFGAQRENLLLVEYETLTTDPGKAMHAIYGFIGEPIFDHDFGHIDYDVTGFDERAGTPGLHTVRGRVSAEPRETLLPPDLFNSFHQRRVLERSKANPRWASGGIGPARPPPVPRGRRQHAVALCDRLVRSACDRPACRYLHISLSWLIFESRSRRNGP
jgi:sulfotransferase